MKKQVFLGAILIVVLVLYFFGFFHIKDDTQAIEKAIQKVNIQVDRMFHIERFEDNSALAIYATPAGLGAGRLEKTFFGWKWIVGGGYTELESGREFSWSWTNLGDSSKPFPVYFGIISNPRIEKVQIDNKHQAKIIDTYSGNRIWFFIGKGISGTEEIRGLNIQGEVIFSRY